MARAVAKAMALLPEEQRTAIILKEYHGLTFQEIADMLECPVEHRQDAALPGPDGAAQAAAASAASNMSSGRPRNDGCGPAADSGARTRGRIDNCVA